MINVNVNQYNLEFLEHEKSIYYNLVIGIKNVLSVYVSSSSIILGRHINGMHIQYVMLEVKELSHVFSNFAIILMNSNEKIIRKLEWIVNNKKIDYSEFDMDIDTLDIRVINNLITVFKDNMPTIYKDIDITNGKLEMKEA